MQEQNHTQWPERPPPVDPELLKAIIAEAQRYLEAVAPTVASIGLLDVMRERAPLPESKARLTSEMMQLEAANIRPVPPPSWRRVMKRGLIFAPFMLLAIALLGRGLSWPARILETVWLLVLFVPFSYMIDRMMYRRYLRQIGQEPPTRQKRA